MGLLAEKIIIYIAIPRCRELGTCYAGIMLLPLLFLNIRAAT